MPPPPPLIVKRILTILGGIFWAAGTSIQSATVHGQIIAYEGNVLPESDGTPWTRVGTMDADRWVDDGKLWQFVALGAWAPGPFGEFDGYNRTIGEFAGVPNFFVVWRETTNCPRSDMSGTPSGLSTWAGPDVFHFTITIDQVRFIRDNPIGLVLNLDIAPNVFHTYYLAVHNDLSYQWYIDGVLVNSGQYPTQYPTASAQVQCWARYYNDEQTAQWDYVRYGVIPQDGSGDFNNNGAIDNTDVYYFVDCLLGPDYDAAGPGCKWADMNADGTADAADIQAFVTAMTGP